MARTHSYDKLQKKKISTYPKIHIDKANDFASIKLAKGIETKSYLKKGFVFSEDKNGRIIEIQVLNLSQLNIKK